MGLIDHLRPALADRYRIDDEIGSGGMATVFRAQDLKHDRTVAIKVLKDELAQSVGAERFLQEIRIVAKLQHPHILSLLDSGEVDGRLYYVMPFVDGESLRERLNRENELPVSDALRILGEVADALAFAHQHGVVHRDIKPDNILMAGRHALVADFGVSKAIDAALGPARVTTTGMAIGTPAYMAPEQAVGDGKVDHRVDLYALGIVGYELLTGRLPFQGRTPQQILSAKLAGEVPSVTQLRPAVPEAVSQILMRCLAERPADRWQTAEELRAQLEFARTASGETTPWGVAPAKGRTARRWKVAGGVGLGVVVLGGVAWMVLHGGPSTSTSGNSLPAVPTLAVLPFENYSGDSAQAYLADGVTEALTAAIAKVGGIHVISRSSAMRYRRVRPPLPQVGRELHADLLMEGSVVHVEDKVRVTAQLIVASTDHHIWSDSYDGDLSDLLAFTHEVARKVAGQVQVTLTQDDKTRLAAAPVTDPRLADAMLQARYLVEHESPENVDQAIRLLNKTLDLDPSFAPAWGLLAHAQTERMSWFAQNESGTDVLPVVERTARRALALDPENPDALASLAAVYEGRSQWDQAVRGYRDILARDPFNGRVGVYLTNTLTWMGRYDEAEAQAREAIRVDPLAADAQHELANVFFESRRMGETMAQMRNALEVDPTSERLRSFVTGYLVGFGHCEGPGDRVPKELGIGDAISEADRFLAMAGDPDPGAITLLMIVFTECGQRPRAAKLYRRLRAIADTGRVPPVVMARAMVELGDTAGVMELLEQAFRDQDGDLRTVTNGETCRGIRDAFRGRPDFEALIDRIGLPRSPLKWPKTDARRSSASR